MAPYKWDDKPWICDVCGKAQSDSGYPPGCPTCGNSKVHRGRVFLGSTMDIFDDEVPLDYLGDALTLVQECEELDFLLVTKRPELWLSRVERVRKHYGLAPCNDAFCCWLENWLDGDAPKNVWAITSTENQEMLEKRLPDLLKIPAMIHGLSCEPLLEGLDLHKGGATYTDAEGAIGEPGLTRTFEVGKVDWIIGGGESGKDARPCNVSWLRDLQRQCADAGIPYFQKQFGSDWSRRNYRIGLPLDPKGGEPSQWPIDMRVRQWPEVRR